ncbi:glycosyl transferase [Desulfocapsa sulfexigens DSM 10523]|uniref:Glycosyl transferase n=1 Tax=Desulfocapsa sulfexigens (strain DSM 10523 / SB164P1) TaxID=1167006 RepID=M1PA86_DESSD|nr:glycosyltransferase family 2 protein [Desulfocapsa sulfexigens]AGF78547.1 glycosyl transferase [Desulfocapsa sulfexigens DSM 10523]
MKPETVTAVEKDHNDCELSIVMPCLNEAETLASCISKALAFLSKNKVSGEIIIADNGSTDGSQSIAKQLGAQVVSIKTRGYGSALQGGITRAKGTYVIMADADASYDLYTLMPILEQLRKGYDLVMGNRFSGSIKPGAMPALHRYLGNPVLSFIGRLFFHPGIRDFHCGLRGFNRIAILNLHLCTLGMEFASEMVVKASFHNLSITEVPVTLYPDGRTRSPHLKSWRDGWRHLRFLLMFSPRWLFLYPGICLVSLGILGMALLVKGPLQIGNISIGIHTLLLSGAAILSGTQSISFAFLAKQFAINAGLLPQDKTIERLQRYMSLELLLIVGIITIAAGTGCVLYSIFLWSQVQFGALAPERMMRILVPAVTMTAVGIQIVITAFFKSILALETRSA